MRSSALQIRLCSDRSCALQPFFQVRSSIASSRARSSDSDGDSPRPASAADKTPWSEMLGSCNAASYFDSGQVMRSPQLAASISI